MDNWHFWLIAAALTLAVAAILLRAMARAGGDLDAAAEFDIKVYKDQLSEIERDLARGTLPPEEADRQRAEVSRRLLDADRALQAGPVTARRGGIPIAAAVVAVVGRLPDGWFVEAPTPEPAPPPAPPRGPAAGPRGAPVGTAARG